MVIVIAFGWFLVLAEINLSKALFLDVCQRCAALMGGHNPHTPTHTQTSRGEEFVVPHLHSKADAMLVRKPP